MRIRFAIRGFLFAVGYISVVLALIVMVKERPLIAMIGLYSLTYLSVMVVIYAVKWRGDIEMIQHQRKSIIVGKEDLRESKKL